MNFDWLQHIYSFTRFASTMKNSLKGYYFLLLLMIVFRFMGIESFFGIFPGILPGYPGGWIGILSSPFFHSDWAHLFSNLIPLIVLGWIGFQVSDKVFWIVLSGIWVLGGLGVYFLGRPVGHIGASGWVYGLIAYLFFLGIFSRNAQSFLLSLAIAILYGGSVVGLFPTDTGISWESHLYSALVGIGLAWYFRNAPEKFNERTESEGEEDLPNWVETESPILYHDDWDEQHRG